MDSLDDILNRVLQKSAEKVAQRIEPVMNRRPLKDPQTNAVGFFQDISAAVRNIRSPEVSGALRSQGIQGAGARYASPEEMDDFNSGFPSSPADNSRRTTIGDDANVLGGMASSAAQIVRQVATAGKAIGQFTGNTAKLDKAVSGMAQTVVAADKDVKASKPTEGFMGWLKSLMGRTGTTVGDSAGSGQTAGSGGASSWLESSSIADSVRGLFARFRVSPAQMTGAPQLHHGMAGTGVSLSQDSSGGEGLFSRISQSFDKALAKSSTMFRGMGRQSAAGGGEDENESWLNSSSIANSVRGFTRKTVSRLGRRALNSKALRQRVMNGQRLIRGRVRVMPAGGGAGGAAAGGGGGFGARIGGMFGGMFGGGGAGAAAAAGGGGAGAGGAGGAAAGGAMAGGAVIAGVALAFVAIVAAAALVVSSLYKLGMQGLETALRVAQFDGQLAAAKSQLDVSRMVRDIGTARTLSEAGAGAMKSLDKLEQALRPLTDGAMQVGLNALTVMIDFVTFAFQGLLKGTVSLVKVLDIIETFHGANFITPAMIQRLEGMANGQQAGGPINVGQRGFFDGQMRDRPFRQPRPPLPPMGGGNGN